MGRKTFVVEDLKARINSRLNDSDVSHDVKTELALLLEAVLFKTNNYHGFSHNYWATVGYTEWVNDGEPEGPEKENYILGSDGEYNRTYY